MKIQIDCDCGEYIKTTIEADYDLNKGEGIEQDNVECPKCHTKLHVELRVFIE